MVGLVGGAQRGVRLRARAVLLVRHALEAIHPRKGWPPSPTARRSAGCGGTHHRVERLDVIIVEDGGSQRGLLGAHVRKGGGAPGGGHFGGVAHRRSRPSSPAPAHSCGKRRTCVSLPGGG